MLDIDQQPLTTPSVSILVAARNEEATILNCLRALDRLDWPIGDMEVLIGNDQSTDQTAVVITEFIRERPAFILQPITESTSGLRGKANVLSQLASRARGQYLFFTDADTQVPATWVSEMTQQMIGQTGIVTGVTLPDGPSLFHKLQCLDWLYNLTWAYWLSKWSVPLTAMGNNMVVSCKAYKEVGGYESLPFSITEDYTLFQAIIQQGFGFQHVLSEQVLAHTTPVNSWLAWFQQRKRWMRGAMELPIWIILILYCQYLMLPLMLLVSIASPIAAAGLYGLRISMEAIVLAVGLSRIRQTKLWRYVLLFDIYQLILGPLAVIYYWLPTKIDWKGRTY